MSKYYYYLCADTLNSDRETIVAVNPAQYHKGGAT